MPEYSDFKPPERPTETYISNEEAVDASMPSVGDGMRTDAPTLPAGAWDHLREVHRRSKLPTRKWLAARIIALGALATMWATTGSWDLEETIGLIGLLTEAGTSYLIPNEPTPGGVILKDDEV